MFYECNSLQEINFNNCHTKNVIDMSYMFQGCSLLTKLNISKFNTNKVINMRHMFFNCPSIIELNLNNINFKIYSAYYPYFKIFNFIFPNFLL